MKLSTTITLLLSFSPLIAARGKNGKKNGSGKGKGGAQCYANEGYAWANAIITDGTCPYVPPSYAFPVDAEPFIVHCSASGGFNVMSYTVGGGGLVPVACCDLCAFDEDVLETCVEVPNAFPANNPDTVCFDNSPYPQGLAVIIGDVVSGFSIYCCGQVTGTPIFRG